MAGILGKNARLVMPSEQMTMAMKDSRGNSLGKGVEGNGPGTRAVCCVSLQIPTAAERRVGGAQW